jgi:homoserine kinase
LYNRIEVRPASRLRLQVSGEGAAELPCTDDNLVWRSACHLWQCLGQQPEPVFLHMHNQIPLSRGLGSSSAAIVGGLLLANQLAGEPLAEEQLLSMATELEGHPDNVAPALLGGLVISATGFSDGAVSVPFSFPKELSIVACIPSFHLATELSRRSLPATVPHRDAVFNLSHVALFLAALEQKRFDLLPAATEDRLHQPYRLGLIPGASAVMQRAKQAGAVAAMISGAGPTMLALIPPKAAADRVGAVMVEAFSTAGVSARAMTLQLETRGARVLSK